MSFREAEPTPSKQATQKRRSYRKTTRLVVGFCPEQRSLGVVPAAASGYCKSRFAPPFEHKHNSGCHLKEVKLGRNI